MEVTSSAVGIASLGVHVCHGVLSYYDSWKCYKADMTITYDCIDISCNTFRLLEETLGRQSLDQATSERVEECLGYSVDGLKKLEKKLQKLQAYGIPSGPREKSWAEVQRLYYPFKESTLAKLRETVADLREHLSPAIQILQPYLNTIAHDTSAQIHEVESNTTFRYEDLDYDTHDFRLLRLLGSREGEVECELYHATFHLEPYEAISYTWGTLELVETIKVNNKTLRVTDNLYVALRHLRRHDRDRVLWIDAVCIDQSNDVERSRQVSRMGDIFGRAEQVVIWLGKATVEVDFLMHWLRQFEQQRQVASHLTDKATKDQRLQNGLLTLLRRPWFSRVWILQEVANAKSAIICAGKESTPAHSFAYAPIALGVEVDPHRNSVLDIVRRPVKVESPQERKSDLGALLQKFHKCEASDERDKIYALLSLSSDPQDRERFFPDYNISLPEVIDKTMHYLFETKYTAVETILDLLTSFSSITAVYLVPRAGRDIRDRPVKELTNEAITQELLADMFNSIAPNNRASLLCIEQTGSTQDTAESQTCYSQVVRLILEQGSGYITRHLKALAWGELKQNVKVLLIHDVYEALFEAYLAGCDRIIEFLINNRATCSDYNDFLNEALRKAAERGEIRLVQLLIGQGADVNARRSGANNALQSAIAEGHEKMVVMLISAGADVNAQDRYFGNALQVASFRGSEKIVETLIDAGADINAQDGYFGNALQVASFKGHEKVVEILINAGADVNAQEGIYGNALQAASELGREKIVEMLINAKADVNAQGGKHGNAL